MKFAIIATSGTQIKVEEGKEILVDLLEKEIGDKLSYEAALFVDEDTVKIGAPVVKGVTVQATVLGHERGDKIRIARFKAKSRSRTVRGFRHDYTRLKIEKITP